MARRGRPRRCTPLQHLMARFFWNRGYEAHSPGLTIREIAEVTGLTEGQINHMARTEPGAFPARRKRKARA